MSPFLLEIDIELPDSDERGAEIARLEVVDDLRKIGWEILEQNVRLVERAGQE